MLNCLGGNIQSFQNELKLPGPSTWLEISHISTSRVPAGWLTCRARPQTLRQARASCLVRMEPATLAAIRDVSVSKGDVIAVARLAGIQGAKRTWELIPLCHALGIDAVGVDFEVMDPGTLKVTATVTVKGRTGVEMEALTAVTVAALTVYDMCKSRDRSIVIDRILLEEKSGGRSGTFRRRDAGLPHGAGVEG